MGCNNKIRYTCGEPKVYSECVTYQGVVSENSALFEQECLNAQEVIEDVYSMVDTIKEEIDLTDLENDCITFTTPKTPRSVISQMYNKLCELEDTVQSQAQLIETMQEQITDLQTNNCS